MRHDIAQAIVRSNQLRWPEMVAASQALYAPLHDMEPFTDVTVERDLRYGPDDRHRLDVFRSPHAVSGAPILVYVHGGGFIGGDKTEIGSPYYDNVGVWAARSGYVGVTLTYRLAPQHTYPAGGDDVGRAVAWIRHNRNTIGRSEDAPIVLMGQSAGASHVATYAANDAGAANAIAGIILLSGVYDFGSFPNAPNVAAYLNGANNTDAVPGIVATNIPLLFCISEFDPPPFHAQTHRLFEALYERDGVVPNIAFLPGHNHISQVANINAGDVQDRGLTERLTDFIDTAKNRAGIDN